MSALRRWRALILLALLVIAAAIAIALATGSPATLYLDPDSTGASGGHALADILAARGQHVTRVPAPASAGPGLELITSPGYLTSAQLAQAARFHGDLLIVEPDERALRALAPRVSLAGQDQPGTAVTATAPDCPAQAAALAGDAGFAGTTLRSLTPDATACYPGPGGYYLIQYAAGGRTVTVLGSGALLSNGYLAQDGNAALALNLLRGASTITWVVPPPVALPADGATQSFFALVPGPARLVAIQLAVAALLAAIWRARRLGPLVTERLPSVVRASETTEGHGRLYQSRRARARAAGHLRAAARARLTLLAGGDASWPALAARSGDPPEAITAVLDGPPPATDEELVALADELDTVIRKISHP